MNGAQPARGRSSPLPGLLLTLGAAALYLATFDSLIYAPDDRQRFQLAVALAQRGLGALAHSGSISKYPPLLSLVAAGPVRLGLFLDHGSPGLWANRLAIGVSLIACVALVPLFLSLARTLGVPERAAGWATLLFTLTNPLWPSSKHFYSEALSAALTLGAVAGVAAFVRQGRRVPLVAGLGCLFLLPLNNMVVPVALTLGLILFAWLDGRRRLVLGIASTFLAGALLAGVLLYVRFGRLAGAGYGNERFTFHVLDGLHGLLFGWGRSIFLFAPLTFLALFGWRRLARIDRGLAVGAIVTTAVCLGVNACWWAWYGGITFGPRLMLPVLPVASLGALALFRKPTKGLVLAGVLVGIAGLYVQILGVAFAQEYDIFYYLKPDYSNERLAWFDFAHSDLVRDPRHFRDQPWDFSSAFLTLRPRDPSTVAIDGRPVERVRITQQSDAQSGWWSVSDIFAVLQDGRRVAAGALGATLETYNHKPGQGALDGRPQTRWTSGATRFDGMWVELDLGRVRSDIVRLELTHLPYVNDFPTRLTASISAGDGRWTEVPAQASTPELIWSPLIFVLAASGLVLLGAGVVAAVP